MKKFSLLLLSVLFTGMGFAQQIEFAHDSRYCRHFPEQHDTPEYAYRNDWQSDFVHDYDVSFYFLDLNISATSINVGGTVTIHASVVAESLETFAFELNEDLSVEQVLFNDVEMTDYTRDGDNVLVAVPALATGQTFIAKITYGGTPPTGGFFSGITNAFSNTWQKNMTWTLSEPFAAKDWWPCKQVLTDKADSVWVFLTTANNTMAGSNGLLTQVTDMGNNELRYEWKSNYPIAYYLISFAVSDYQDYSIYAKPEEMNGDSVLVQNFLYNHPSYLPQYQSDIDAVVPMIELFSNLYVLYPFKDEKYGHCITLLGGGMEHQTMTTMGGWSFNLVSHELGHMWFGDNVTCATWSDIWVNEGFATYSNYLAQEKLNGWNSGQNFMIGTQNNVMSSSGGSVYVPPSDATPDNIWRIFDGRLSYDKGAAIIHVLRHEINNDTVFFDVMSTYQTLFKDSTATGDDFRMVAEEVTGMDLEQFFNQWYYGQGYPRYDIEWYMSGDVLDIFVTQSTSSLTPLFQMTMDYKLVFSDNTDTIVRLYQETNLDHFVVPVSKQVTSIQVDPNNWTFERVNSIILGQDELNSHKQYLSVYPNPVQDMLHVNLTKNSNQSDLFITDMSGKTVLTHTLESLTNQIDVQALPKGTYLVYVRSDGESHVRKLIK